ncbi:MAG TPA: tyrosine-protein phosphatase [Pyrinomonadaceae bacterium]|jgi:protein tyrosine/serine phosphatase|nr:tyrosine-protein phosphatase [Pyrinomonadaceae bacterium]
MKSISKFSPAVVALLALVFAVSPAALAQKKDSQSENIKIKNFGQMDERFFRGARPKPQDLQALAALGITTIIDLTDNSREYEQPAAEAAGLRYINIPMVDKSYPSMDQINEFMKVVNDPATGKFFVHCAGGRHRTGVVGAVYRFNVDKWNLDQVMDEMNHYDFGSGFGHGKQKDFVKKYWNQFQTQNVAAAESDKK